MDSKTYAFETNDTVSLFYTVSSIMYIGCGTNFMFDNLKLPPKFVQIYNRVSKIFELLVLALMCSELGAFITQKNLTFIEKSNLWLYGPTGVTVYTMYVNAVYRKEQIRRLCYTFAVTLKRMYSDVEVERKMIKKTWRFIFAMGGMVYGLFLSTGVVTGYAACTSNATFTTVIPAWPALGDRSVAASICRVAHYLVWFIYIPRVGSIYIIILVIAIALQHQYRIMHDYFISLNGIFDAEGSQEEKEVKFEDALKLGVKMHSLTLWCLNQTQETCGFAFSSQVIANVFSLIIFMVQWMHMERTFGNCLNLVLFAGVMLIGTGIVMWNAGDITFEAANLPTAMFHSGWHNCRGQSSARVRKLVTIAMRQAQERVVIKGFGIMELSYEAYISIVKASYSVFSVIY